MNDAPLLDTHAWVWWVGIAQRLGQKLVAALDALPADRRPYLSDISLWEAAMLAERGRVTLTLPLPEWLETAAHPRTVQLVSITPEVAAGVAGLPTTFLS